MIGRLRGILVNKQPPQLLVDVQGVGYELEASMSTFYQLPASGQEVVLHTHLVVREDAQLLYGFYAESERQLFRNLIRINGVGPKLALTILSGISAEEFTHCIIEHDTKALTSLPGVGKKTAERLIVELRDRLGDELSAIFHEGFSNPDITKPYETSPVSDAVSALVSLGYKAQEASRMVRLVEADGLEAEAIIRAALKGAGRRREKSKDLA